MSGIFKGPEQRKVSPIYKLNILISYISLLLFNGKIQKTEYIPPSDIKRFDPAAFTTTNDSTEPSNISFTQRKTDYIAASEIEGFDPASSTSTNYSTEAPATKKKRPKSVYTPKSRTKTIQGEEESRKLPKKVQEREHNVIAPPTHFDAVFDDPDVLSLLQGVEDYGIYLLVDLDDGIKDEVKNLIDAGSIPIYDLTQVSSGGFYAALAHFSFYVFMFQFLVLNLLHDYTSFLAYSRMDAIL